MDTWIGLIVIILLILHYEMVVYILILDFSDQLISPASLVRSNLNLSLGEVANSASWLSDTAVKNLFLISSLESIWSWNSSYFLNLLDVSKVEVSSRHRSSINNLSVDESSGNIRH